MSPTWKLSDFVGKLVAFPLSSLPTKREILFYVLFLNLRQERKVGAVTPSNSLVFGLVADRVLEVFRSKGFSTVTKRSVVK